MMKRLRHLRVDEVSLVDAPANPHARIVIAKRAGAAGATDTTAGPDGSALVALAKRRAEEMARAHRADPIAKRAASPIGDAGSLAPALAVLRRAREQAAGVTMAGEQAVRIAVPIEKRDADKRIVSGWANVIEVGGVPVVDTQGHVISLDELTAAAHGFVREHRAGKLMHSGPPVLEVVESVIVSTESAKAMGLPDPGCTGWWIVAKVHDDAAWRRVKSGELRALSIGGKAVVVDASPGEAA